jgi:hypothetical protein
MFLTYVLELKGSDLDQDIDYTDLASVLLYSSISPQADTKIVPHIKAITVAFYILPN